MGRYEVTFDQYDLFARATARALPSDEGFGRGRLPVVNVSWDDAVAYTSWLSAQSGKRFRLPSESEWEYAARAGTTTTYPWGDRNSQDQANGTGTGGRDTFRFAAPVGSFPPNAWGLYDMIGNVGEWVLDCYSLGYEGAPDDGSPMLEGPCDGRMFRGGQWDSTPTYGLRVSSRPQNRTTTRYGTRGFRIVEDIAPLPGKPGAAEIQATVAAIAAEMVDIPAGHFRMGDLTGKGPAAQRPAHEVTLKAFKLSKFELTFEHYDVFARATGRQLPDDEGWGRGKRPAIYTGVKDAEAFIAWLNAQSGLHYRLPSEAEWEYADRAGTTTVYPWGDEWSSDMGNAAGVAGRDQYTHTSPVGSFPPNPWGLYDMNGNVTEWVADCWNYSYEGAPSDGSAWRSGLCDGNPYRGGAWDSLYIGSNGLTAAQRPGNISPVGYGARGFRLARDP
jgi:formylglycine-generating enzyme required for sulfatase activity